MDFDLDVTAIIIKAVTVEWGAAPEAIELSAMEMSIDLCRLV
jgi:hypothetical protein